MIVVDASVVIELLLGSELGRRVAERIAPVSEALHAPHLIDLEVAQVLRRLELAGEIDGARARAGIDLFLDLDIERHPHEAMVSRIWALRSNITAYDAAYVALAEILPAPLLTADRRLAAAAGSIAEVELLSQA